MSRDNVAEAGIFSLTQQIRADAEGSTPEQKQQVPSTQPPPPPRPSLAISEPANVADGVSGRHGLDSGDQQQRVSVSG